MTFEELQNKVLEWANDRGLLAVDPAKQLEKTQEELYETREALYVMKSLLNAGWKWESSHIETERTELQDGIGDMLVTIIIFAALCKTNINDCLSLAYDTIKNRTGRLIDGKFVKDS